MWIRSQDGELLINASGFFIVEESPSSANPYKEGKFHIVAISTNDTYTVGRYDTKKEALDQLNKIDLVNEVYKIV